MLKKVGIKLTTKNISYKNKTVPLDSVDTNNLLNTVLKPLGIRKTKGSDYWDGKSFIKSEIINRLKATLDKIYNVTISFDWTNQQYDVTYKNKTTSFATKFINDEILQKKALEKAREYAKSRSIITDSSYDVDISNIQILDKRLISKTDLRDVPVFGNSLTYPKLGMNNLKDGVCGYNLLIKNYPKKAKSIQDLQEFFKKDKKEGLCAYDFYNFCHKHNITLYVCDLRLEPIMERKKGNNKIRALIIVIANNHVYEIKDEHHRKKIFSKGTSNTFKKKNKKQDIEYVKEIPETINKKFFVDKENLNDYYNELLDKKICYPARFINDDVTEIHMKTGKLICANHFQEMKEVAKELQIEYTNQTPAKLAREYFDKIKADWKESTPNRLIRQYIKDTEIGAFNQTLGPLPEDHKIVGIDIVKQYTYIAQQGDFHYADADNEVFQYNGENIQEGCFYYIMNTMLFPLGGNSFFDYKVVAAYLEYKLIQKEDIKFYFTTKKQPNVLKTFINDVYKTGEGKVLTNLLIGSFNITESKVASKNYIVDNWLEAGYYFHLFQKAKIIKMGEYFRVQGDEKQIKLSNNKLVYMSIVQRANLDTYKLLKYTETLPNFIPLKIKTDCIYGAYLPKRGKPKIPKNIEFGSYRLDNTKPKLNINIREPCKMWKKFVDFNWHENPKHKASEDEYYNHKNILEYDRVLVEGKAGTGKSNLIHQIRKDVKDAAFVSFTNTAANNINGQTIHNLFNIGIEGNIDEHKFYQVIKNKSLICIDEGNQVPHNLYRILCAIPKSVKIYMFADFRQEEPVKEHSYRDTQMLKTLLNYNYIRLKKQCRADPEFANACSDYHDTSDFNVVKPYLTRLEKEKHDEINITRTNLMRKSLNREIMEKKAPANSQLMKWDKTNPTSQDMYLYVGLPVIATKTRKSIKLFNNEMYLVESFTEKEIELVYRKLNKKESRDTRHTVTYDDFRKLFAPAYAITTYKIEGASIDIPHTIWEFNMMKIKSRYTALTRTTSGNLILINNSSPLKKREEVGNLGAYECFIYKITDGEQVYIGSTAQSIKKRFEQHKEAAETEKSKLYKYMRQIGKENFTIEKLHQFTATSYQNQLEVEEYFIEVNDSVNYGLNSKYY